MAEAPRIQIPRWIQLVGLPLVLLLAWALVGAVRHTVFLFIVAALVALLLDPLVRALGRIWIPRGISIALVYVTEADGRTDGTDADRDVDRLQAWLDDHGLKPPAAARR
ncbi:MAG: hypothetical protein ABR583_07265 [Gaiellaceae bacterium]